MHDWIPIISPALQVIIMASTVMAIFFGLRGEVRVLRHDVQHLEDRFGQLAESFKQIGSVLTQVAVQDTRLSMIEKHVDELKHGRGFVNREDKNPVRGS